MGSSQSSRVAIIKNVIAKSLNTLDEETVEEIIMTTICTRVTSQRKGSHAAAGPIPVARPGRPQQDHQRPIPQVPVPAIIPNQAQTLRSIRPQKQ